MKRIFIILVIVVICVVLFGGCDKVKYNNSDDKENLITQTYSSADIENLKKMINTGGVDLKQLRKLFKMQCVRKTHQGYYVVLSQEEGKNAFVFIDQENQVDRVMVVDRFRTKKEFEDQIIVGETTMESVLSFDPSSIHIPVSRVTSSAHIVQEGAFLVVYSRRKDRVLLDEPIVNSVQFFSNQDILSSEDDFVRLMIPYVLEMDKFTE